MKKLLSYITPKSLIIIVDIMMILIAILPYSYVFGEDMETGKMMWRPSYLYESEELMWFYIPLAALLLLYQVIPSQLPKRILFYLALIASSVYSFIALLGLMAIQDYLADWGNLLSITIAPLMYFVFVREKKIK